MTQIISRSTSFASCAQETSLQHLYSDCLQYDLCVGITNVRGHFMACIFSNKTGRIPMSRLVKSGLFMAHVRASTFGTTSRENCHPFTFAFAFDRWSFAHNGGRAIASEPLHGTDEQWQEIPPGQLTALSRESVDYSLVLPT